MSFYYEWMNARNLRENDITYILSFLRSSEETLVLFNDSNLEEMKIAIELLNSISIDEFISAIIDGHMISDIEKDDILQFSSLEDGIYRVNEILHFYPNGLDFVSIGEQLIKAENDVANRKYGENHAKLAEALCLVSISKKKPRIVKNTFLGESLLKYEKEDIESIYCKLLLRNRFIQNLVYRANNECFSYFDEVKMLSPATALRRRSNTRSLLNCIYSNSHHSRDLEKISWRGGNI